MNPQARYAGRRRHAGDRARRGHALIYTALSMGVVMGMAALAIDIGRLYVAKSSMQRAADAAALAATWRMLDENRMAGGSMQDWVFQQSRAEAADLAALNTVMGLAPIVNTDQDVVLGYWADFASPGSGMVFDDPGRFNAVAVNVRRDDERGGSISMTFARALGINTRDMSVSATAAALDGVIGFEISADGGNADVLPFALHEDAWNDFLAGIRNNGDSYSYDPDTGAVSVGSDGVAELNIYPGGGGAQLPPGNFGTVDIGSPNNSAADIARQIVEGVDASDLAYFGGQLRLGADGTLTLNGDTGLSAGVKDELTSIRGLPRSIPLFREVSGPGNNANFTVTGFAGVRIVNVKLTGSMSKKEVLIQPALVVDESVIATGDSDTSYFIYRTPQLVR